MTGVMTDAQLEAALVGGWELRGWTLEYPADGRVTEPFGPRPDGLLLYTADGCMSAVLQRPGRPRLSSDDPRAVGQSEKAAAFSGYVHYAGRWRVSDGRVIHEVRQAMNPNLIGSRQLRHVSLAGDRLELVAEEMLGAPGRLRRHRIRWARVPPHDPAARGSAGSSAAG